MKRALPLFLLMSTSLLAACAVGPDFTKPAAPGITTYTENALPQKTATAAVPQGDAQIFADDKDVPADWWVLFKNPALNELIERALKTNPDVAGARAALKAAEESALAGRGALLPQVDASPSITRERFPGAAYGLSGSSPVFTLYNASVNVSYAIDIFGQARRALEALNAKADIGRYELEAAYLTLTANVVTAAVQEASLREQIRDTNDIIDIESKQLEVLRKQFALGSVAKSAVLAQVTLVAQVRATLPPLAKQLAQTRNQLAVLAGHAPSEKQEASFTLAELTLPENIPVSLPSKLVEQRPDIKAAEATLHAASASVGVATANMFPQLTLTGSYGTETNNTGSLFTPEAAVWSLGAGLLQPIFHGGTLLHQKRAAEATYDEVRAQYQSTVLHAFGNVADTLKALELDADGLAAEASAEQAAKNSLDLAQAQFKDGAISYPQLLDAERTYLQTRISLVQAEAARLADTAALFQALGGGWWNRTHAGTPVQTLSPTEKKS